jgi:hypothetical protein
MNLPTPARMTPGPEGRLSHEPCYVAGRNCYQRGEKLFSLNDRFTLPEQRMFIQGWHDAKREAEGKQ